MFENSNGLPWIVSLAPSFLKTPDQRGGVSPETNLQAGRASRTWKGKKKKTFKFGSQSGSLL